MDWSIVMPFGGRGRLTWLKEPCIRRGCTLAPPDEYSGMICAAVAMRDVTTFAAATFFCYRCVNVATVQLY